MKTIGFRRLLLLLALAALPCRAELVIHNRVDDAKEALVLRILELALAKAGGQHELRPLDQFVDQARAFEMLKKGGLSVLWAGTTQAYEAALHPIRIPILKGMLGCRVFLIRKGDQARFDQVRSLDDLARLRAGQGTFWGDTAILRGAGLQVVSTVKYANLFPMLDGGRFDYFPRALHEAWSEVERHKELDLAVEQRIALVYPFPMYFFVAKDDAALGARIERGLERAIADGSYDALFFGDELIRDSLAKARLKNRLVLRIPNPDLPAGAPLGRPELWLDFTRY